MSSVSVNKTVVGFGNDWDFYPDESIALLQQALTVLEIPFEVKIKKWKYKG